MNIPNNLDGRWLMLCGHHFTLPDYGSDAAMAPTMRRSAQVKSNPLPTRDSVRGGRNAACQPVVWIIAVSLSGAKRRCNLDEFAALVGWPTLPQCIRRKKLQRSDGHLKVNSQQESCGSRRDGISIRNVACFCKHTLSGFDTYVISTWRYVASLFRSNSSVRHLTLRGFTIHCSPPVPLPWHVTSSGHLEVS